MDVLRPSHTFALVVNSLNVLCISENLILLEADFWKKTRHLFYISYLAWFKHILFMTRHDKGLGRAESYVQPLRLACIPSPTP